MMTSRLLLLVVVAAFGTVLSYGVILPTAAAVAQLPDTDGDTAPDDLDACPTQPGLPPSATNGPGCPAGVMGTPPSQGHGGSGAPACDTDKAIKIVRASSGSGNRAEIVVDVNIVGRISYQSSAGAGSKGDDGYDVQPGRNTLGLVLSYDRPIHNEVVEVTLRLTPGPEGGERCTQPDGSTIYSNELAPGPPATVSVSFLSPERQATAKPTGEAADIDAILAAGGYRVELRTTRSCTVRIVWYHTRGVGKPVVVADGSRAAKRGLVRVNVELTAKGRALLEGATQIKVMAKGSMRCAGDKKPVKTQKAFTLKS
jgi:hypothetical protein